MAATVTVRLTREDEKLIFAIVEGLDHVQALPGYKGGTGMSVLEGDAPAGADSAETMAGAAQKIAGPAWRKELSWEFVDERGLEIRTIHALAPNGEPVE